MWDHMKPSYNIVHELRLEQMWGSTRLLTHQHPHHMTQHEAALWLSSLQRFLETALGGGLAGSYIGILEPNHQLYLIEFLAIVSVGAIPVLLNTRWSV